MGLFFLISEIKCFALDFFPANPNYGIDDKTSKLPVLDSGVKENSAGHKEKKEDNVTITNFR